MDDPSFQQLNSDRLIIRRFIGGDAETLASYRSDAAVARYRHRLFSRTDARNVHAQRLLERLGFRREAELRESTWFKGAWATELIYAQLESEWRPEPAGTWPT